MKKFLLLAAAAAVAAGCASEDAAWREQRQQALNRKRQIIYNNDGCDAVTYPADKPFSIEEFLLLRVANALGTKIDTISYGPEGSGFYCVSYPTRVGSMIEVNWPNPKWRTVTHDFVKLGTDPVAEVGKFCRKHNYEFFVSLRVNDTHDGGQSYEHPHFLASKFKIDNQHLLLGTFAKRTPYCTWSAVDFTHEEVRKHMIDMVTELLERYDMDGLELDFCRHMQLFRSVAWGGVASPEELDMMTDVMRRVRALAEKYGKRRGHPILISIRVYDSPGFCRAVGIDLDRWLEEDLIDIIIGGSYFHLRPWGKTAELAHRFGKKFYGSMDESRVRSPRMLPGRNTPPAYHARMSEIEQQGCDGIYSFNWEGKRALSNLFFAPEDLAPLPKFYFATQLNGSPESYLAGGRKFLELTELDPAAVPSPVTPDTTHELEIFIGDDFTRPGAARAKLLTSGRADTVYTLRVNGGKALAAAPDAKGICTFPLDPAELKRGSNRFSIGMKNDPGSGEPQMIVIYSGSHMLTGKMQPPWRRIYDSPGDAPEMIVENSLRLIDEGSAPGQRCGMLRPMPNYYPRPLVLSFDLLVESTDDPDGVTMRVADGKFVEVVRFEKNRISLKYGGKSAAFDTADRFHTYRITLDHGVVSVDADGKNLISGGSAVSVSDPASRLTETAENVVRMHDSSIYFGSLSSRGRSSSRWRNLRVNALDGTINDFVVEVYPGK